MSTPSPTDPLTLGALKPVAGRALERALAQLLALDPETVAALAGLEGRRIELALEAPAIALAVTVRGGALRVGPARGDGEPDLGLRATLGGLLSQLPFARTPGAPPVGKLRINGDADLARTLQQLAQRFDPDWDAPFARALGPILGPQVARVLRDGLREGRRIAGQLARDGADYLTEERRDVVGRAEHAAYLDDVDGLRDRVERLAARVAQLDRSDRGDAA